MKKKVTLIVCGSLLLCGCQKGSSPAASNPTVKSENQDASSERIPDASTENGSNEKLAASQGSDEPEESPSTKPQQTANDEILDITFDDIKLPIQEDIVFRPFMLTARAKELDGQRVRISGFMLADAKIRGIEQFVLLKNTECKFGPGGQADHLVNVIMNEGNSTVFRNDAVAVEGVIKVNPFKGIDGNTWSIYDLACERVEKHYSRR